MDKLIFTTTIDAPAGQVWRTLLEDATYREWTSEFAEGSYVVTDWKEGSKALFLSGSGDGMVSRVAAHRPNEFLSLEHLGMVKDGVEDLQSASAEGWSGAHENYILKPLGDGQVELTIEMDTLPAHREYFEKTWPKALARLKRIAEPR
jgi:uncharacterized protein YndB with AHSA1/START domain